MLYTRCSHKCCNTSKSNTINLFEPVTGPCYGCHFIANNKIRIINFCKSGTRFNYKFYSFHIKNIKIDKFWKSYIRRFYKPSTIRSKNIWARISNFESSRIRLYWKFCSINTKVINFFKSGIECNFNFSSNHCDNLWMVNYPKLYTRRYHKCCSASDSQSIDLFKPVTGHCYECHSIYNKNIRIINFCRSGARFNYKFYSFHINNIKIVKFWKSCIRCFYKPSIIHSKNIWVINFYKSYIKLYYKFYFTKENDNTLHFCSSDPQ